VFIVFGGYKEVTTDAFMLAWHVCEGFAVQFLERASEIKDTFSLSDIEPTCRQWDAWYKTPYYKKDDSGL
jgi:hypothetical protein